MFTVVSECLIELEPMVRKFDEIDFLEAVLEIKRSKVSQESFYRTFFKSLFKCFGALVCIFCETCQ